MRGVWRGAELVDPNTHNKLATYHSWMFILRHLVHAAKQIKPKGCSHLHTAFIDFKQAYDTIDRPHLWDHLNKTRMPTHLVNVIKQMYDGESMF